MLTRMNCSGHHVNSPDNLCVTHQAAAVRVVYHAHIASGLSLVRHTTCWICSTTRIIIPLTFCHNLDKVIFLPWIHVRVCYMLTDCSSPQLSVCPVWGGVCVGTHWTCCTMCPLGRWVVGIDNQWSYVWYMSGMIHSLQTGNIFQETLYFKFSVFVKKANIISVEGLLHVLYLIDTFAIYSTAIFTSPPEGVARYCFHPVCVSVCLCICVSGQYFGILFLGY